MRGLCEQGSEDGSRNRRSISSAVSVDFFFWFDFILLSVNQFSRYFRISALFLFLLPIRFLYSTFSLRFAYFSTAFCASTLLISVVQPNSTLSVQYCRRPSDFDVNK